MQAAAFSAVHRAQSLHLLVHDAEVPMLQRETTVLGASTCNPPPETPVGAS